MVTAAGERVALFSLKENFGTSSSIEVKCPYLDSRLGKYLE